MINFESRVLRSRDRSRSPRERDRDRDRHGPSRDDRRSGRGGRGGGGNDHFGRGGRGSHQNNPRDSHQSRFSTDNKQSSWLDRRGGGRIGGRGGFHHRQQDVGGQYRHNEQLPSGNYLMNH